MKSKWNPIETAPKDGTRILLLRPFGDRLRVVCGEWNEDKYAKKPRPFWSDDQERVYGITYCRDATPTGWQPLPDPPERP